MNQMAKVFSITTKENAQGLHVEIVMTMSANATIAGVLAKLNMRMDDIASYEVSNTMPLMYAMIHSANLRQKVGIA